MQPSRAATAKAASLHLIIRASAFQGLFGTSRLLKNVLEGVRCTTLIQHSVPWRTKDLAPRGPRFENCASLTPSRVFQQPAGAKKLQNRRKVDLVVTRDQMHPSSPPQDRGNQHVDGNRLFASDHLLGDKGDRICSAHPVANVQAHLTRCHERNACCGTLWPKVMFTQGRCPDIAHVHR